MWLNSNYNALYLVALIFRFFQGFFAGIDSVRKLAESVLAS